MVATVEDGRITKLRPDPDHPLSRGYACPKGIAMAEVQNDPDRVTHPLRRAGQGELERVSWEVALGDIAARLRHIPGRSVAWYMGNPGAFSYSHALWVKGFLDALGSPHYYSAGSQDVNNRFAASALLYGSPLLLPIPDLRRTAFLLMVGANPLVSHGSVLSAPRVREQLLNIERVVVVDPRRTETARQFEHLPIRPDTDAFLLLSLIATVFEEGLADWVFLRRWAEGAAELERLALAHPPEVTEARTGIPAARARELARDFAAAEGARSVRPHRLVPRALWHAGGVPARRAERRHRQRRSPWRLGVRPAAGGAGPSWRAAESRPTASGGLASAASRT
jgi:anaerobic selenocysteine-containing dehydrogenase